MRNTRPASFAFLILLYNWCSGSFGTHAAGRNFTVDDTDVSILYQPAASWHSSSVPCPSCLQPDPKIAYKQTFHDGTHIIPTSDDDDSPSTTPSSTHISTVSSTVPMPSPTFQGGGAGDDHGGHEAGDNKGGGGSGHTRRQSDTDSFNPFATSRFDDDDDEFVDDPVFFQFNFTGSAVYLYCIIPEGRPATANAMPTSVNLTFTIDGKLLDQTYQHQGSTSSSGFTPNVTVFAADGLSDEAHSLRVDVGPDSVFLFDYLIYTRSVTTDETSQVDGTSSLSNPSTPTPLASESSPDQNNDQSNRRHNVATFAGAVGGSVGVLAIFALCLAGSIYYRRRRSARRQRMEREFDQESLHTDASEDSPRMVGPAPFVPRYFPGSVPSAPPPYIPSTPSTTSLNGLSQAMAPYTPLISARPPSQPASPNYADVPPPIRPLPMSEVLLADDLPSVPPPSFGEAIASPLTIPINLPLPPGIQSPADSTTSRATSYEDDNDYTAPPEIPVPAPAHTTAPSSSLPGRRESSDPIHPLLLSDFDQSTPATPHDPPHRNSPHSPSLSNHCGVGLAR